MLALIFRSLNLKTLAIGQASILILAFLWVWQLHETNSTQRVQLQATEVALQNPKVIEKVRTVTVTGPVRIRTIVVEKPSGEKETTTLEVRESEVETVKNDTDKTPVSLAEIAPASMLRSDRWLVGLSNLNLSPNRVDHYTLWGGYGIKNRVDLLYGVGYADHFNQNIMVLLRF